MKLEQTGVIWYQPHARVQIIPFSSWHPWARAAWLGAFYLSKEERLCGGSPCFLAAVTLSCSLHGCPHSISWPSVSSRSTAGPRNQLTSSRTDLFSRVPTERSCAVGNILRTWTMLPASILCPPDGSARCVSVWLRDTKWAKRISNKQRKLVTVVQKPAGTSQTQPNQLHFH